MIKLYLNKPFINPEIQSQDEATQSVLDETSSKRVGVHSRSSHSYLTLKRNKKSKNRIKKVRKKVKKHKTDEKVNNELDLNSSSDKKSRIKDAWVDYKHMFKTPSSNITPFSMDNPSSIRDVLSKSSTNRNQFMKSKFNNILERKHKKLSDHE